MNGHFTEKEIQVVNKHIQLHLVSLIRKVKIKTTMGINFTPQKCESLVHQVLVKKWSKRSLLLVWVWAGSATLGTTRWHLAQWRHAALQPKSLSGFTPQRNARPVQWDIEKNVPGSIAVTEKQTEKPSVEQMSTNKKNGPGLPWEQHTAWKRKCRHQYQHPESSQTTAQNGNKWVAQACTFHSTAHITHGLLCGAHRSAKNRKWNKEPRIKQSGCPAGRKSLRPPWSYRWCSCGFVVYIAVYIALYTYMLYQLFGEHEFDRGPRWGQLISKIQSE